MNRIKPVGLEPMSAYVHIPFCEHICYYCDFNKVFLEGQPVDEYIQALLKEIQLTKNWYPSQEMATIYIGGGTPTSLSEKQLATLLEGVRQHLPFDDTNEFTIEANPGDLNREKLHIMKNFGVNRLSMGVQTFDNQLLKKIGRKHTAEDVYDTMRLLTKEQFFNVSIDLIYALPGQTLTNFKETLNQALSLDLPHYSLYSLILENKTMFMNWSRQGRLHLPNQEEEALMFEMTITAMEQAGRKQYEVSNFALPGQESQHNLMYWNNDHYYGFGAGASGYISDTRYRNHGPIQHYLQPLKENRLPMIDQEILTTADQIEEEMFLGLRKKNGISKQKFFNKFGYTVEDVYGQTLQKLLNEGLIIETDGTISLSSKGLFLGNDVFEAFLIDQKNKAQYNNKE